MIRSSIYDGFVVTFLSKFLFGCVSNDAVIKRCLGSPLPLRYEEVVKINGLKVTD